ncbi:MAG: 3-methyl-2-oxobutanoate hydroxymethyltransferase [Spirochaetales bacterium]|nr:3-methyl-2-oxobutanoate hydroxymethyltransferase [Spirochaetales bacterium]
MKVTDFFKWKKEGRKISMVTCYDYTGARILNDTDIDSVLVGDSLAMVMHGFDSTLPVDSELIALHTRAVRRGAPDKFIIGDMPFLSFRKGLTDTMNNVEILMKAGANAVKLEGVDGHEKEITRIVQSGVPVMGHIGLTPQSLHAIGGFKVQGRNEKAEAHLLKQAKILEELGCFSIVLECIPADLARRISDNIGIPTIGIGAGIGCDGQVLVWQDLLGMNLDFSPKFVRRYMDGAEQVSAALNRFHDDVVKGNFPSEKESYS